MLRRTIITNTAYLKSMLIASGEHMMATQPFFIVNVDELNAAIAELETQHPEEQDPRARATFRILTAAPPRVPPSAGGIPWATIGKWVWYTLVTAALLYLLAGSAFAQQPSGIPPPGQGSGLLIQLRNEGTTISTRPAGLVPINCVGAGIDCTLVGGVWTVTVGGGGSSHAILSATHTDSLASAVSRGSLIYGNATPAWAELAIGGASTCLTSDGTDVSWAACSGGSSLWSALTAGTNSNAGTFAVSANTWDFSGAADTRLRVAAGLTTNVNGEIGYDSTALQWKAYQNGVDRFMLTSSAAGTSNGQIPIWDNTQQTFVPGDPLVQGLTAHDAAGATTNPVAIGGYASAAAPTSVSTDGDIVRAWFLLNGQQVVNIRNNAGTEIFTAGAPGNVNVAAINGVTPLMGNGVTGTGSPRVTIASDNTAFSVNAVQSGTWDEVGINDSGNSITVDATNLDIRDLTHTADSVRIGDGTDLALVNGSGELLVTCSTCSGSGVSHIDDAAFAPASDDVVPIAGAFDDTTPDSVNEGDAGVVRMSANRNLFTTLRDAAGNERGANVTASNELLVNCGNCTGSGVSHIDGATFTGDTDDGAPAFLLYDTTPPTITDGDAGLARMGSDRVAMSRLTVRDASDVVKDVGYFTGNLNVPTQDACGDTPGTTPVAWVCMIGGYDGTNTQRIKTDTNGELQIDIVGALPAGTNYMGRTRLTDGTDDTDVLDLTNSNPLVVAIVDSAGTQISSFGGGTQYTEGDTDATITGTAMLWEDAANTLRPVASGTPLPVTCATCSGTGVQHIDDAVFTNATDDGVPIFAQYDTTPDAIDDGDAGIVRMTSARVLMVDGSATTQPVSGTVTANAGSGTFVVGDGAGALNVIVDSGSITANAGTNLNTSALLTTTNFTDVFGAATLLTTTQADNIANTVDTANVSALLYGFDGTTFDRLLADGGVLRVGDGSGAFNVIVDSSALPTGASTSANQTTIIGHVDGIEALLNTIDSDTGGILSTVATLGTTTYAEATTTGITMGAVRRDADTTLVGTTNEIGPLQMDANGRLKVEAFSGETLPVSLTSTTITGTVAVTQSGTWTVTATATDLDIRDLTHASDSVRIGDGTDLALVNGSGELLVTCSTCSGSGVSHVDDTAFTNATDDGVPVFAQYDTTPDAIDDGDAGVVRMNSSRILLVDGSGATQPVSGTVTVTDGSGALNVIVDSSALPSGASTSANQTTEITSLQLIDDPVAVLGTATYTEATTSGFVIGAVRRDADTTLVGTTNEIGPLQMDANGRLKVEVFSGETLPVSGTVTVTDGAGALNVIVDSGALTVSATDLDIRNLVAATDAVSFHGDVGIADQFDLTNSNPLGVAIVDANGDQITSFGGGTQYTEDAAAAANPVGTAPNLVRADTPGTITDANGDNVAQRGTNYGAAYVQVVSSSGAFIDSFGGSGGTAQADRSAFTDGTTNITPIGGCFNDTATDPTEDQAACVRITAERAMHVNLRGNTGTAVGMSGDSLNGNIMQLGTNGIALNNGVSSAGTMRVTLSSDSTGNIATIGTSVTPGTAAANLGKAEDAAHASADTGVAVWAVRDDTLDIRSGTENDYEPLHTNAVGALWVAGNGDFNVTATNLDIRDLTAADVVTVTDGAGALNIICDSGCGGGTQYAEDTALAAGEQVTMAGVIRDATPASLVDADGDRTELQVDGTGYLWSRIAVIDAGDNNIGNVDIVSSALPTGASTLAEQQTQTTALQLIDDAIFVDDTATHATGTTKVIGIGAVADPTDAAVNANDIGMPAMNTNRALKVILQSNSGVDIGDVDVLTLPSVTIGTFPDNEPINVAQINGVTVLMGNGASGTGAQRVTIANDSTGVLASIGAITTSVTPGTAAANLGKAEDAVHGSGDTGVMALALRDVYPPASVSSASGDYEPLHIGDTGALYVRNGGTGTGATAPWSGYVNCDNTAIYSNTTNGNTQLVALTTNETIVVCGFQLSQSTTTAVNVRFVYGTGTACATGETSMTPTYPLQAATSTGPVGMMVMTPGFLGMKTAVSNALCIETNAAVSVQALVWYAKFDETP